MAYNTVTWAALDAVTSQKLQQMSDNDEYVKDLVEASPRGVLARAKLKTTQTSSAVWWDVTGLALNNVAYGASRTIRASVTWQSIKPVGMPGIWEVRIQSGNSVLAKCRIDLTKDLVSTGGGTLFTTGVSTSAATQNYKVSLFRVSGSGSGSISWEASATGPSELVIEDIGAAVASIDT